MQNLSEKLLNTSQKLTSLGLNVGTAGNCSVRINAAAFLITPSGVATDAMTATSMVRMQFDGSVEPNK
ncbi:MAG TPA: class II aldolase/adducin family protein, partial [Methylophilaceae bacterium]|nr:class II aldolase/adducin family protein [Methylophilaceae bacterium]